MGKFGLGKIFVCFLVVLGFVARGEAEKVRLAYPAVGLSHLVFSVAKDQEEGLDLDAVLVRATLANQALVAGQVEFTTVPAAGLNAALRGANLRMLFTTTYRANMGVHANPKIQRIEDLKGKKVAVSSPGSGPTFWLREVLKRHGLDGDRDVIFVSMGRGATRYAALVNGAVDAVISDSTHVLVASKAGYRELVNFMKEDWLVHFSGGLVVREDRLRSERGMVKRFLRGAVKALRYM